MYAREDDEGWVLSNGFKKCFSIDIEIDFMGVFFLVFALLSFFLAYGITCPLIISLQSAGLFDTVHSVGELIFTISLHISHN